MAIGRYVAQRAGIGINAGRIRGLGAKIRGGEVQHTGVIPFLKKFESTVRCCTQNGVRGEVQQFIFYLAQEIEDIIVLKNNKGTEDNRVRKLDYSIQLSELFYKRFLNNEEITLFSPHDVLVYTMHLVQIHLMRCMRNMRTHILSLRKRLVQEN